MQPFLLVKVTGKRCRAQRARAEIAWVGSYSLYTSATALTGRLFTSGFRLTGLAESISPAVSNCANDDVGT